MGTKLPFPAGSPAHPRPRPGATAHRVRPVGRWQPGREPGRDAARAPRTRHRPGRRRSGPRPAHSTARRSPTPRISRASRNSRRYGSSSRPTTSSPAGASTGRGTSCGAARTSSATTGLAALIHHSTPARSFSDLEIPLRVIATDLDTGEEVVLARGPLKPALLASTALPGVFPIVVHGGRRLVDGGVVNNVPLWHALSGPVDRVFVLNVSAGRRRPRGALTARRRDDELHARPQPALRARTPHAPSSTSTSSISPARATPASSSTSPARAS